jgi:type VI secretion system secreted protein Hcp
MAAVDFFLELDGIEGESGDSTHPNSIDVVSFSWSVAQGGIKFAGSGASAAKSDFTPIGIFKHIDKASPRLMLACATGEHIKSATLFLRDSSRETNQEYFKITLSDVLVSSYKTGQATDGNGEILEEVSLSYQKVQVSYKLQNPAGGPDIEIKSGFDVKKNVKF